MPVIYQKKILREDLRRNLDAFYIFGDNEARVGLGGLARETRGEPNAFGIATKKSHYEFMSDNDIEHNKLVIGNDVQKIFKANILKYGRRSDKIVIVLPFNGIGTGLADLPNQAPETFAYLQYMMKFIVDEFS